MPDWAIITLFVTVFLGMWEAMRLWIDPLLASYPSAILAAAWKMTLNGRLPEALWESS